MIYFLDNLLLHFNHKLISSNRLRFFLMSDDVFIEYETRRLQTIPCSLYGCIKDTSICHFIDYAVEEMRYLRFWGSRFMGFHLSRLLHERLPLPKMTDKTLRATFICVAKGAFSSKDERVVESLKMWKEALGDTVRLPSIRGLNTITTSSFEEYFVSFENYHLYGMQQHWSYLVSMKYELSRKHANMVVRKICESFELDVLETFKSCDDSYVSKVTRDRVLRFVDTEKKECPPSLATLEDKVKWHYGIANRIHNLESVRTKKLISMTPLCSGSLPFIEVCKKSMSDLVKFATSKNSHSIIKADIRTRFIHACYEFGSEQSAKIDTMFRLPNRANWSLSPTIKTDGYGVCLIWQKNETIRKKVTPEVYAKHHEKKNLTIMKWEDELSRAREKGIKPDLRKRLGIDKQPFVQKTNQKVFPSKDKTAFEEGTNGMYSQSILHELSIRNGTPVYAVDPGMHDIVSCAKQKWIASEAEIRDTAQPEKSKSLSSKEFYGRIRCGKKVKPIQGLSECSLKEINPAIYLQKLGTYKDFAPEIFATWGRKVNRKTSFKQRKKKQQLYDTIVNELFPEEDAVIVMGNGNIQTTMKGTSTSPLGKITSEIIKKRRMVFVNEAYTTKRCSWCKESDFDLKALRDTQKGQQVTNSGKTYYPMIHGLRQCQHCARTWNRDYNAARNIFFNACSYVATGCPRDYLRRKTS